MTTAQSMGRMSAGEVHLECVERGKGDDPDNDDEDVGSSHFHQSALARTVRSASDFSSRSRRVFQLSRSFFNSRLDSAIARVVSAGAGPPKVVRTSTK